MSKRVKRISVFLAFTFGLMYLSHGLIAFLLETTSLAWGSFPFNTLMIIGGGAPAFAALYMVWTMYDKREKRVYWERTYLYQAPWFWWVVTLLSPLLIGLIANLIYYGGWWNPDVQTGQIIAFPLTLVTMIVFGGMEELGWRGILQDTLSKHVSLPIIGVVIGLLWGLWHGPLFLIDEFAHYHFDFSTYLLSTIAYSLLLTLVVYKTNSILLAILLHAGMNAFGNLGFGIPMEVHAGLRIYLLLLSLVLVLMLHWVDRDKHFPRNAGVSRS